MACANCSDLCVRFAIRTPKNLEVAINIARQNIEDGTIFEVTSPDKTSDVTFDEIVNGSLCDMVFYRFCCKNCGELFVLHAETYHGSGGYWEPEDSHPIKENIYPD